MNAEEKLAAIAALCDELDRAHAMRVEHSSKDIAARLRAILDVPSVDAARAGGIDRDALLAEVVEMLHEVARDAVDRYEVPMSYPPIDFNARATDVLALVQPAPPAPDLAVVRRILTAALPADPKWAGWVEGRIEEIAAATPSAGVVLTHRDVQTALGWYADAFRDGETPAGYDRDLAQKLGDAS